MMLLLRRALLGDAASLLLLLCRSSSSSGRARSGVLLHVGKQTDRPAEFVVSSRGLAFNEDDVEGVDLGGAGEDVVHLFETASLGFGEDEEGGDKDEGVDDGKDSVCVVADPRKGNGRDEHDEEVEAEK